MSKPEFTTIGKSIFEFRYDPIVSFYDWRGSLAEHLINEFKFDGFRITENRVDLVNPDSQDFLVFVGMQNAGLSIENNTNVNVLQSKIKKFIEALQKFENFRPKKIARLGVRTSFLKHKKNVALSQVRKTFEEDVIRLNKDLYGKLDKDAIIDVGLPLNFKSEECNFNIAQGPMEQNQALEQFFTNKLVYKESSGSAKTFVPKHGFFFDIDVFKLDLGEITLDEVQKKATEFAQIGKEKFDLVSDGIFPNIK